MQASSDKSFIRFNTASSTAVMEIGAANGEKGDDRLTLRMGNIDNLDGACSYGKIRKVGTGNLDLGETRHSKGTEINDGTVTVVHPSALLANVKANTEISFGGGTLRYGASVYADTLGEDITTDYSAYIKNSTAPVSIDTNGKDITWKTALSTSNTAGITKKGEGVLKLDNWGDDNLNQFTSAERTILIEGGTLAVVNGRYNQTPNLNAKVLGTGTLRIDPSQHDGGFRLNSVDALNEFAGTLEWANDLDASQKAIGFLTRNGDYNLANLKFRVTGTPETAVEVLRSEMTNGRTLILGAMDHLSANAKIKFNETSKIKVTGDRGDSYLNGTFANKAITLIKGAKAKLTLGAGFNMLAGSTLEVEGGTFENHANLANYTVNLAAGTALAGDLTSVPAAKLTDYTVVLPAKESVDKKTVYDLVKVPAGAAAPTVDLTALNAGETKGKWKIRKNVQGVYQLFWAPTGLAIIVR